MYRRDFVRAVAEVLRVSGARKPVSIPKHVLHVSDDEGNSKDFSIKKADKNMLYTVDDVNKMVDACIDVIERALKAGDDISIHGFGTLGLRYRKARRTKNMLNGDEIEIEARFVPKFIPGKSIKTCARVYSLNAMEASINDFDDDDDDDDEIPEWVKNDGA